MHLRLATCALALALAFSAGSAEAEEAADEPSPGEPTEPKGEADSLEEERARAHFRVAQTLYQEGRFEDAAAEFESAHRLSGRPELLFNMYVAYRDAGILDRSARALRQYLDEVDDSQERAALTARLRVMEERLVFEQRSNAAPPKQTEKTSEETADERAPAPPPEPAPATVFQEPPRKRSPAPLLLGSLGAGMLATGAVTGLVALRRHSNVTDECPNQVCPPGFALDDRRDRTRRMAIATDVLLLGGGTLFATGLLLYLLDPGSGEREWRPSANCGPTGCAASVRLNF